MNTATPFIVHRSSFRVRKSVERICKPNSVFLADEDHSSVTRVAAVIEQPTRKLSNGNGRFHRFPIWSCSAGGLPCRRRSRGTRCALTAPFHPCLRSRSAGPVRRFAFCCTVRRVSAPGCYPACCPLEFGLSSAPCDAAILRSAPRSESNRVLPMKIADTKLFLFQVLRTIVGLPTLKMFTLLDGADDAGARRR